MLSTEGFSHGVRDPLEGQQYVGDDGHDSDRDVELLARPRA